MSTEHPTHAEQALLDNLRCGFAGIEAEELAAEVYTGELDCPANTAWQIIDAHFDRLNNAPR